jgi:predicted RNase H-like nuclease (RuvC/YqgF family)
MANTDVTKMAFFAVTDPTVLTVDFNKVEEAAKKARATRDAAAPPPDKKDLQKEYNRLRQQLFDLKQNAKGFEQRTNDAAGNVELFEQRIDDLLKLKKAATAADNLRGVRFYEHGIQQLENELADAKEDYEKNHRWSAQAARALKAFDGHGRIAELKAILDSPEKK